LRGRRRELKRRITVKNKPGTETQSREKEHLKRLRDFLDLPINTLNDDVLSFALADTHQVIARYIDDAHLSLICEIANLDAVKMEEWRSLLVRLSAVYDPAFPASLVTIEGKLAVTWVCGADAHTDKWLRWAQDALTWAVDIQMRFNSHSL
jgi:hypothetical protein